MEQKRFVGIDLGKRTYEIKFIASNGSVTGTNGKTCPSGRKELYKKLLSTDRIAIEVCSLGMVMAKEIIQQVGAEVVLLNPSQIALIYRSVKKNDKEDALKLARLVQKFTNEELPKIELPTEHEENLRQILTELRQLKNDRTKEINRVHAIFVECGITEIKKSNLATHENRIECIKILKGIFLSQAERSLKKLELIEDQILEVEELLDNLISNVTSKGLACETVSKEIKAHIISTEKNLNFCKSVEEILLYYDFALRAKTGNEVATELRLNNLLCFESPEVAEQVNKFRKK